MKLVVDAKYKEISLDRQDVYGSDVRQVGDYCTTLGLAGGILVYPKLSPDQKVHDLPVTKKDPLTSRSYKVLLKTVDLFPADLVKFKSACDDFRSSINEILLFGMEK